MKKKIFIFSLPVVAVAALVAYLVFGRSSATYLSALPKDARALVRVDLPACFEEAQLTSAEQLQFVQHFMPVDGLEHVGLDWHQPLFAFISQQGNIGFLAAVSEPDDLSRLCVQLYEQGRAGEPTLQRGLTWVVVEQQWLLAFDDVKALVLGPAVGADQERLRTEMAQFMTQKEKDSGQQNVLFTRLHTDKAVSAVVSPDVLPSQARQFLRTLGVHSADDALMLLSLEADGRELKLDAEILAESEEAKDEIGRAHV